VALIRAISPDPAYLVIRRANHPQDPWSGHFSLPGGKKEPADADLLATCLRETEEEVGLSLLPGHLVRPLPIAWAGSALGRPTTSVQPFLFEMAERPPVVLLSSEVASVHWVSETFLLDRANHVRAPMLTHAPEKTFPGLPLADYFIWGFTYGILRDLLGGFPSL